ncbi:MAG: M12 family metallo-peptidase, partial [Phycisphaerae bacterium]
MALIGWGIAVGMGGGIVTTGRAAARVDGDERAAAPARADVLRQAAGDALGLLDGTVIELDIDPVPGVPVMVDVPLGDAWHTVVLEPQSVRAPGYQVLAQVEDGSYVVHEPGPVRTLRGVVEGIEGSAAAGSVLVDGLYARIMLDLEDEYWIEPIGSRVAGAGPNDYVVYRGEDVLPHGGACANEAKRPRFQSLKETGGGVAGTGCGGAVCVAELGVDADTEYFNAHGSVAGTEAQINAVINTVNVQYESQVAITHLITTIIVRTSTDPYTTTDPQGRLCQFILEWTNNQTGIQRDVAHLFTGANLNGGVIGIAADIGGTGICVNSGCCGCGQFGTQGSYTLAQSDFNGNFSCATDLSAHELGHLWGAFHCNCPSNTMNPFITCANNFSAGSINSITAYRDTRLCLDGSGPPPVCGNGIVEPGEQCDPPDGVTCDANCQFIGNPVCTPSAGDCCTANGTPGCNDSACCDAICAFDPFCCDTSWDSICANEAAVNGSCPCGAGGPANDNCADAVTIPAGDTAFDTNGATTDGPSHPECDFGFGDGGAVMSDIWYAFTPDCDGDLTVSTCNTANYDTKIAVYSGCSCPPTNLLGCNDDGTGCAGFTSLLTVPVTSGVCTLIRVGGFNGATGSGTLNLTLDCGATCTPPDCNDGNPCTQDICNAGQCTHPPMPAGTACGSPGNSDCDNPDTCDGAGNCQANNEPNGAPCPDDGNQCTDDVCGAGACTHPNAPNGTPCNDGLFCTVGDACTGGACGGQPRNCADGVACTADTCNEGNDTCLHVPDDGVCDNGDVCDGVETCNAGTGCVGGTPLVCDDGNPCTQDLCDPATGCAFPPAPAGTPCTGNGVGPCTGPDVCNGAGGCDDNDAPDGPNPACDDQDVCTSDECSAGMCTHPNAPPGSGCTRRVFM